MLDLDPCGSTNPLGMFPLFFKRTSLVMALCHSVVFRRLIHLGSFSACWRQANVTPIPKDPRSSSVANYRPISITSVLSKMFERLVYVFDDLWHPVVCFQPPSLLFGKVWVLVINFCVCPIHCRVHWRVSRWLESRRLISVLPLIGSII